MNFCGVTNLRHLFEFDLSYRRCIYCGYCQFVCPTDAKQETRDERWRRGEVRGGGGCYVIYAMWLYKFI